MHIVISMTNTFQIDVLVLINIISIIVELPYRNIDGITWILKNINIYIYIYINIYVCQYIHHYYSTNKTPQFKTYKK